MNVLSILITYFFFFQCYGDHQDLHSFPTRRSSDLPQGLHLLQRIAQVPGDDAAIGDRYQRLVLDRKSTRLNSSHVEISYAVFCLKKKTKKFSFSVYAI